MIESLTLDEISWRFGYTQEEIWDKVPMETSEELKRFEEFAGFGYFDVEAFTSACLVYLHKFDCITINLHKNEEKDLGLFFASKEDCQRTLWINPEDSIDRPSGKIIPIPDIFAEKGNEEYTHISVNFYFPETELGRFCEHMMNCLRIVCKEDVHVINTILFMDKYFTDSAYPRCMRRSLYNAFEESMSGMYMPVHQLPSEVHDIIDCVLEEDSKELYDPFMRTGINIFLPNEKYHGQTMSKYHYYSTKMFLTLFGEDSNNVELKDCIQDWDPRDCDTIIVNPRFGQEITTEEGETESVVIWALAKTWKSMNREGRRAVMLFPASVLTSSGKLEKLRHDITEANLLDAVVLLPANVFSETSIAVAIIMLRSGRKVSDPITLADFSSFIKYKDDYEEEKDTIDMDAVNEALSSSAPQNIVKVSLDNIREKEYDWFPSNYIVKAPNGYRKVLLSNLIEPLEGQPCDSLYSGILIREHDLVSNPFDEYKEHYMKDVSFLPSKPIDSDGKEINYDDYETYPGNPFIIEFGGSELKTYFKEFEFGMIREVSIPNSCGAFLINTDLIDVNYLRLLLTQVDSDTKGEFRKYGLKRFDGKGIDPILYVPNTLEEQRRIYEEAKLNNAVEKARKEGLDKAIDSMKQEYMMEVRMRKHDMKPFLSQLDSQAKLITFYLDKIEGNDDVVSAIRQKLTGISNAVSELRLHLNRLTEEDIFGTPEVVNPLEILNELTGTFSNYSVALEIDTIALKESQIETPEIFISKVDFSTLATTIIENAVSHAFTGEGNDYKVLISLSYNANKDVFTIDFKNNGNPMPQGMDKFRYGLKGEKGAKSNGTGLGGYRVKSITRHYDGDYDVFCNRIQNTTTIRVMFPKYNSHE